MEANFPNQVGYTLYCGQNCGFCDKAKKLLKDYCELNQEPDLQVTIYEVEELYASRALFFDDFTERGLIPLSHRTVPVIYYQGEFLGGYSALEKQLLQKLPVDF